MKFSLSGWMVGLVFTAVHSFSVATSAVYEGFDYPASTQLAGSNGGTGFSGAWSGDATFRIDPSSLSTGGPTSGGHITVAGNGTVTRQLSQTLGGAGTVRYLSVFVSVLYPLIGNPPKGADRVGLTLNGSGGAGVFFGKPANQFIWALQDVSGSGQVAGPPMFPGVPSIQTWLVIKCEFLAGNDRFTLYANPVPGRPEPATGTVKFDSDVGSITSISFTVSNLEGFWMFDEVRLASTFEEALPAAPANHPPIVANPIQNQNAVYGSPFTFTIPSNTMVDSDAGQTLTYGASGLPAGISFDPSTRTFNGAPTSAAVFPVVVTATDSGSPPQKANASFDLTVAKAPLIVSVDNVNRAFGESDPVFTGTLVGVTNNDNVTVSFASFTTSSSPPGVYPIMPTLIDPDSRLANYNVTTNLGSLTIGSVMLSFDYSQNVASVCWPTSAGAFRLEFTETLAPPVTWQTVNAGFTTNGSTVCVTVNPVPAPTPLFYRLHLP